MSAENVEIVRRMFDAYNRGDFEASLEHVAEDVEWGPPPDMLEDARPYRGHDEVVSSFARFMQGWAEIRVDIDQAIEAGDRVVLRTHWQGRSKGTGIEVDQWIAQVVDLRDGKVVKVRQFRELPEALAAANEPDGG